MTERKPGEKHRCSLQTLSIITTGQDPNHPPWLLHFHLSSPDTWLCVILLKEPYLLRAMPFLWLETFGVDIERLTLIILWETILGADLRRTLKWFTVWLLHHIIFFISAVLIIKFLLFYLLLKVKCLAKTIAGYLSHVVHCVWPRSIRQLLFMK